MKNLIPFFYLCLALFFISCQEDETVLVENPNNPPIAEDSIYFPGLDQSDWETISLADLDWDEDKVQNLIDFAEDNNSKSLLILKNGKIAIEEYFNGHNQNATWPWFSTAKSLTSVAVGIAQDEGLLNIENRTSDYLGNNWALMNQEKQDLITVKNHLTMTTGMVSSLGDIIQWSCIAPLCMRYEVDGGTRWAYHQGAFTQTQEIISAATGVDFRQYIKEKVENKIGVNGSWTNILDIRIFNSNTRGMARFGLLALNEGNWDGEQIYPLEYHQSMVSPSQQLNKAYGYLWWLNGSSDFLSTQDQNLIQGELVPNAPSDMFAALGAQDQKIYVIPSQNLVVIRTGDPAGAEEFALSSFDNQLWEMISQL